METHISVRPGVLDDLPFLEEMLFEAAYWHPDRPRPPHGVCLARPDLVFLLKGWGREGDTAVIAITGDGQPAGAAWYRFWGPELHSYGYVSPEIPEMGIAVKSGFRGIGIGHKLLDALLKAGAAQGVKKISLSVEVENRAQHLYRSHGFEPLEMFENSWTMVVVTEN